MSRKIKILLIEDEAELADNIKTILELNNFEVTVTGNGEEGIKFADKILPDIILSDILLPSKNGYEVLKAVSGNKNTSHIPFIFLTAKVTYKDLRKGMELGADDYIYKPFKTTELISAIRSRLKRATLLHKSLSVNGTQKKIRLSLDDSVIIGPGKKTDIVKIEDISCILAERQYSSVVLSSGKSHVSRKPLRYWENILPEGKFIRVHRSTIINLMELNSIIKSKNGSYIAVMNKSKREFKISRSCVKKIRHVLFV